MWNHSLCLMYRGSISHGTHIPSTNPLSIDDVDIFGIYVPPKNYLIGLDVYEHFEVKEGKWDVLCYDIRKFFHLLIKMNPNVMNALWTPEKYYLKTTKLWNKIVSQKDIFISKKIFKSFCGYSQAQLHKMESMVHNGYMGEKRKELVKKFGYDTKNAQHLIRLLRQGTEFLKTGELLVERPDAEELKRIKRGKWSLEKVHREAKSLFFEIEEAHKSSTLPEEPNREKINELLQETIFEVLTGKIE